MWEALWLVHSSPDRAVWIRALARKIVLFLDKPLNSCSASLHPGV